MAPRPMSPPLLKICGLRTAEQAAAVARLGADAIGMIAVEGTPRFLEAELRPFSDLDATPSLGGPANGGQSPACPLLQLAPGAFIIWHRSEGGAASG